MEPQPAQPKTNFKQLSPFIVIGVLILVGVVATTVISQTRNNTTPQSISESQSTNSTGSPSANPTNKELFVIVDLDESGSNLIVSLDPQASTIPELISYSMEIFFSPALTATELVGNNELIKSRWSYPVKIVEPKDGGTSVRFASLSTQPLNLNQPIQIATIPLTQPYDQTKATISIPPQHSVAYDMDGAKYQLMLAE